MAVFAAGSCRRGRRRYKLLTLLLLLLLIPACAHKEPKEPTQPVPSITTPPESKPQKEQQGEVFVGLASYYGYEQGGDETANRSSYDPTKLTAAHRTLPFGTRVRVTNLENNRSVVVVITDRGPARADRIIDLSLAAAKELRMLGSGVVKVRLEVLYD